MKTIYRLLGALLIFFNISCCRMMMPHPKEDCVCSPLNPKYTMHIFEGDYYDNNLDLRVLEAIHEKLIDKKEFPKYIEINSEGWHFSIVIKSMIKMDGIVKKINKKDERRKSL